MLKNIIFDFDGTLADSFQIFVDSLPEILSHQKIHIPIDFSEFIIKNIDLKEVLREHKIWFFKLGRMVHQMQRAQYTRINDVKLYEGIPALLSKLNDSGYRLYIVSTNTNQFVNEYVKIHDIKKYFHATRAGGTVFGKGRIIRSFMKKHKLRAENSIYIGDEERDIRACHEVGLRIISVTWGFKSYEFLKKFEPDYIVKSIKSLEKLILEKLPQEVS